MYSDTTSDDVSSGTDTSESSTSSDCVEEPKPKRQRVKHDGRTWKIEAESNYTCCLNCNFKWLLNDSGDIFVTHKQGEKIVSPIFAVGFNNEFKWQLEFYPRGNESARYPSLHLCLVSSSESKVDVQYHCFILNHKYETHTGHESLKQGDDFPFPRFRSIDNIGKTRSFTVSCEVNITIPKPCVNKMKIIDDLKALFDSGSFSDVTLEIENKKFKVHKYVLAARSPVFDAMFKSDMRERQNNIVEISDVSYDVMKELLRFTYTGEVENLQQIAKELLAAADKYAFDDLKTICENSLYDNINVDNVVDILNFAELYNASNLKKLALEYIVNNITRVIQTPSFKGMGDSQSPLLAQMICLLANKVN